MPSVVVEDLPLNCTVTIIVTEIVDMDDPKPPAEAPIEESNENIILFGKQDSK